MAQELVEPDLPQQSGLTSPTKTVIPAAKTTAKSTPTSSEQKTTPKTATGTKVAVPLQAHSNITNLPTFSQRGTAIAKRLESVQADPKYKKLSPVDQSKVRRDIYQKYVVNSYKGFGLPVPDEKTWVEASGRELNISKRSNMFESLKLSDSYNESRTQQFGEDFYAGVDKAYSNMTMFGAHITNQAFSKFFGLDEHHSRADEAKMQAALPTYKAGKKIQQALQNLEDSNRARVQSADFWLQTHPRDTTIGRLASDAGEFVAALPLYEAVGAVSPVARAAGAVRSTSLTAKLMEKPVGKFVLNRLNGATNMYLSTLAATGGDQKQAVGGAVVGEALSTAGGKLAGKIASSPLIKKWTANVIAMGGKPFAQDVAHSAWSEAQPLDWWLQHGTEAGLDKYPAGTMKLSKDLAIFPKSETEGHFVNTKTNQTYYYKGKEERQLLWDHLHKDNLQLRQHEDPVMHNLHQAETASLESIAQAKHGKSLQELGDKEKLGVLGERFSQINEAAVEAPAHLPDLLHDEVEHSITEARQQNPELNAFMAEDEKQFGAKFAQDAAANAKVQVEKQTGISNTPAASRKLRRVTKTAGDDISPRAFASLNSKSVSYLSAPRDRSEVEFINSRSKDSYDKTYQLLKQADGGFFQAEKPIHRFLYHYANKAKLPAGLRQSILHWIKQTPGFEGKTEAEIFQEAKNLHVHMYDMAKSGRLKREGNIFASTKTDGPMNWSPWQEPLSNESDQAAIAGAQKALARHPEALKGFNTTVKTIQKQMLKAKTPEELQMYKDALDTASRAIKTHIQRGTAKIGVVK